MTDFRLKNRVAIAVLAATDGSILGSLPPRKLSTPWLQEIGELVSGLHEDYGVHVSVVRLLEADESAPSQISATYLVELESSARKLPLSDWNGKLSEHPLRPDYARAGGPARLVEWAVSALAKKNIGLTERPHQIRTWNLSAIWRIETDAGRFWLKAVPRFFGHEGAIIELFADERVPRLIDHGDNRVLMRDIPGEDCYDASFKTMLHMIETLVDLQWRWRDRLASFIELGVPDWRDEALIRLIRGTIERNLHFLNVEEQGLLTDFSMRLPEHVYRLQQCGIPDSLVHGDFHPGNWRGEPEEPYMLDWGDCGLGQPLLDQPALLARADAKQAAELDRHWQRCWARRLPDADVALASKLAKPLALARNAGIYQKFLDNIEPSEHVHHESDPADFLQRTCRVLETIDP